MNNIHSGFLLALVVYFVSGCSGAILRDNQSAWRKDTLAVFVCLAERRIAGNKDITALVFHETADSGRHHFLHPKREEDWGEGPDYSYFKNAFPSLKKDTFDEICHSINIRKDLRQWLTPPSRWTIAEEVTDVPFVGSPTTDLITFSMPAFDKELMQALVYIEYRSNSEAGGGEWVLLEKSAGMWIVIKCIQCWIS